MVTLNKIYTRTGDDGTTGVVTGERLSKTDQRIIAIGDVDEVNSAIGVAMGQVTHGMIKGTLLTIQNDLFDVGADLATPKTLKGELRLGENRPGLLEKAIDELNEDLPPLKSFILPSGPGGAGALHFARSVARRAERSVWQIKKAHQDIQEASFLNPLIPQYLNRLSDYLFVAARTVSIDAGGEVLWVPGGSDQNATD
ncbi:MAG: cob(I)yrinic acid a,c-diamide adenosyltransferase [Pseudomonadota bacterium]